MLSKKDYEGINNFMQAVHDKFVNEESTPKEIWDIALLSVLTCLEKTECSWKDIDSLIDSKDYHHYIQIIREKETNINHQL